MLEFKLNHVNKRGPGWESVPIFCSPGSHRMWWWTTALFITSSGTMYAAVCSQHRLSLNGGSSTLEQNGNRCKRHGTKPISARWRHQMETFSALLAICVGNSPVTGEFPAQRPVTRSFVMFSLICAWINGWVNNLEAGDLRCHRAHYDVTVMDFRIT